MFAVAVFVPHSILNESTNHKRKKRNHTLDKKNDVSKLWKYVLTFVGKSSSSLLLLTIDWNKKKNENQISIEQTK